MFRKAEFLQAAKSAKGVSFDERMGPIHDLLAILPDGPQTGFDGAQKQNILEKVGLIPAAKQRACADALRYLLGNLTGPRLEVPFAYPHKPWMMFEQFDLTDAVDRGNVLLKDGYLGHWVAMKWVSSDGDLASLSKIMTRERVASIGDPTAPPFNQLNHHNPNYTMQSQGAQMGKNQDHHFFPSPRLICRQPPAPGSHVFEQVYEYSYDKGATWIPMKGAYYRIEKGVRLRGTDHVMYFKKYPDVAAGGTDTFQFEVEYAIGAPPAHLPAKKGEGGLWHSPDWKEVTRQEFELRANARVIRTA